MSAEKPVLKDIFVGASVGAVTLAATHTALQTDVAITALFTFTASLAAIHASGEVRAALRGYAKRREQKPLVRR